MELDKTAFKNVHTRSWIDLNGCNPIQCSEKGQQILILHSSKCVGNENRCRWTPYILSAKSEDVTHLQTKSLIKHTRNLHVEILWPHLCEAL